MLDFEVDAVKKRDHSVILMKIMVKVSESFVR
jgi:hypothetical protein